MNTEKSPAEGRGLAEPHQKQIEERAGELARAAGRETINEYDLAMAREEILGASELSVDGKPESQPDGGEAGEELPS